LGAKLEAVLASQIREIVRKIENRVVQLNGTAHPTAKNLAGKTANIDHREPTCARDAGVEGIVLAIGEFAGVVNNKAKVDVVEAEPEVVQQAGTGGPNPVRGDRIGAYWISVLQVVGCVGVIFCVAIVLADEYHAIDEVLAAVS